MPTWLTSALPAAAFSFVVSSRRPSCCCHISSAPSALFCPFATFPSRSPSLCMRWHRHPTDHLNQLRIPPLVLFFSPCALLQRRPRPQRRRLQILLRPRSSQRPQPPPRSCAPPSFGATRNQVVRRLRCLLHLYHPAHKLLYQEPWRAHRGGARIPWRRTLCPGAAHRPKRRVAVAVRDGWRRHPQLSVPGFMRFCDYFGTWVFAISGTLTAATSGLDLLGCVVVGSITALGGGTARDMIMGQVPPALRPLFFNANLS